MKFWQWLPVQYWWLPVAWLHPGPRPWWISECPGKSCKVNLPEPQQHCCIYVMSCRIKLPTPFISLIFVNFSSKHESWVSKPGSKFICNSTWPHSPVFPGNRGLTSSWILLLPSFGASVLFFGWVSRSIEKQHFFSTAMSTKSAVSYLLRVQRTRTNSATSKKRIGVHSLSIVPRPHPRTDFGATGCVFRNAPKKCLQNLRFVLGKYYNSFRVLRSYVMHTATLSSHFINTKWQKLLSNRQWHLHSCYLAKKSLEL